MPHRNIKTLRLCRPVLLSCNFQSEHFASVESVQTMILSELEQIYDSVGQYYFQVTSNLNMSQQGKRFKQRYYGKFYNLRICSPGILSVNIQSEHVAAGKSVHTTKLSEHKKL